MTAKILGNERPTDEALTEMCDRGGSWACYQNHDLGASNVGHLQFIKYGPDCTFKTPPAKCPDTQHALGWRYVFVGIVDLETGDIVADPEGAL